MTFETALFQLLGPLAGNRVFPDIAPFDTPVPYVTWQKIGGRSINYTGNDIPTAQHSLVQINVWSDDRLAANTLASQIEDVLRMATAITARPEAETIATHDPDLQRYGTIQDFSIWSPR